MSGDNISSMPAAELAALASQCYGQRWQSALARDMDVNVRTVQRWARDGIDRPATADSVRRFLTERRVIAIPSPDPALPEEERDDACYTAMEPVVSAVAQAADEQGWHPAEVWVAILAVAADNIYRIGGKGAAVETVQQAIDNMAAWPEQPTLGSRAGIT